MTETRTAMAKRDKAERKMGDALDEQARRQRSGAVRTAWIIGAVAMALFVLSLVEGHLGDLYPSWIPKPIQTQINAVDHNAAIARASKPPVTQPRQVNHGPTPSQP